MADSLGGCGQRRTKAPPPSPAPHLNYLQHCRTLWERHFGDLLLFLPWATAAPSRPLPKFATPAATAGSSPQQKVAPSAPCALRAPCPPSPPCPHITSSPWLIRMLLPAAPPRSQPPQALMGSLANPPRSAQRSGLEALPFSYVQRNASFILSRSGSF